jgi:hypothetical protein
MRHVCPDCTDRLSHACDYCQHYDYNGEDRLREDGRIIVVYVRKGWCRLHQRRTDPGDVCDCYRCHKIFKLTPVGNASNFPESEMEYPSDR